MWQKTLFMTPEKQHLWSKKGPPMATIALVLGRTQFVGSKFGIFGGFEWVRSSIMVDKPGFRRVQH